MLNRFYFIMYPAFFGGLMVGQGLAWSRPTLTIAGFAVWLFGCFWVPSKNARWVLAINEIREHMGVPLDSDVIVTSEWPDPVSHPIRRDINA